MCVVRTLSFAGRPTLRRVRSPHPTRMHLHADLDEQGKGAGRLLGSRLCWKTLVPCQGEWLRRKERYVCITLFLTSSYELVRPFTRHEILIAAPLVLLALSSSQVMGIRGTTASHRKSYMYARIQTHADTHTYSRARTHNHIQPHARTM